jgi:haloalkane dehalogenase
MVSEATPAPLPAWLTRMFPRDMRRTMIDVGGLRMHVAEWGAPTDRPVLLLHGNPSWGFLYREVVANLAGGPLRLVVPDLVGLGCSDKPRDPAVHTLPAHGDWVGRVIDALSLRDLVFVGQDWGGAIGMYALASRMERLAGMVVLNTVLSPPRAGFRPTWFHRFSRWPVVSNVAYRFGFPMNIMQFVQGDRGSISGDVARGYRWPLRRASDRVAPLALARMVPNGEEHPSIAPLRVCDEAARSFNGPVAIVWGDADPVLGRVIGHMQRMFPSADVTRTRAGHFLQEEVPREIARAIVRVASAAPPYRSR